MADCRRLLFFTVVHRIKRRKKKKKNAFVRLVNEKRSFIQTSYVGVTVARRFMRTRRKKEIIKKKNRKKNRTIIVKKTTFCIIIMDILKRNKYFHFYCPVFLYIFFFFSLVRNISNKHDSLRWISHYIYICTYIFLCEIPKTARGASYNTQGCPSVLKFIYHFRQTRRFRRIRTM